jgi:disulfide bond formation protein DsbB
MQHALPAEDQPTQADASALAGSTGMLTLFSDVGLLVALLAACLATAGSLFFSEVWGWIPCVLCWYQRILMYPLVAVLAVGILRRDPAVYAYVLPLSLAGMAMSLYHYLLIKTDLFPPPACQAGIPCDVDYLNLFGFINIPFLALLAFAIISVGVALQSAAPAPDPDADGRGILFDHGLLRAGAVAVIILGVTVAFLLLAQAEMQRVQAFAGWGVL